MNVYVTWVDVVLDNVDIEYFVITNTFVILFLSSIKQN